MIEIAQHCEIALSQGRVARVSFEDYAAVNSYKWTYEARPRPAVGAHATGYAYRLMRTPDGSKRVKVYLHRFIAARFAVFEDGTLIDHVDGNGLNCMRTNLRAACRSGNTANRRNLGRGQSGYIGVYVRPSGAFEARVVLAGAVVYREMFADAEQAAIMRDRVARQHFGDFAVLNFPDGGPF